MGMGMDIRADVVVGMVAIERVHKTGIYLNMSTSGRRKMSS